MEAKKILVIDDDRLFRTILKDALRDRFRVYEAEDGAAALSRAQGIRPDLIILDIEMSGKDGIATCRELKQERQTRDIPVLLLTAHGKQEDIIRGLQAGADDYLIKPISPPEVLARLDAHFRPKQLYRNLEREDLLLLLELGATINACRNPLKVLQLIVDKVAAALDVARCSIVTITATGQLLVKASSDLEGDREITLELEKYPEIGQALKTRRAVLINDLRNDPLLEPVRRWLVDLQFHSVIVIPIIKKESLIGTFFLRTATPPGADIAERISTLCQLVADMAANALENAILFESLSTAKEFLQEMAIRDGLTHLYTHRHFYDRLDEEFSRSRRYHQPLSLIFFDIDDFKQVNDMHGHTHGDDVLRQIGRVVREIVRESDIPARYGGEEFAILLPNTDTAGALDLARRLHATIGSLCFAGLNDEWITVSTGIATFPDQEIDTFQQLVERADQAMYRAKSGGKDQMATTADL